MVHKIRYEMRLVLCDYVVRRYDTFNECNRGWKFIPSLIQSEMSVYETVIKKKLLPSDNIRVSGILFSKTKSFLNCKKFFFIFFQPTFRSYDVFSL